VNHQCVRDTLGVCRHPAGGTHVVFVLVDGRLVFFFCLILIAACIVWLCMLARKGIKFEEES